MAVARGKLRTDIACHVGTVSHAGWCSLALVFATDQVPLGGSGGRSRLDAGVHLGDVLGVVGGTCFRLSDDVDGLGSSLRVDTSSLLGLTKNFTFLFGVSKFRNYEMIELLRFVVGLLGSRFASYEVLLPRSRGPSSAPPLQRLNTDSVA